MDWFVWKDNEQIGPLSREAIQAMGARGEITPTTLLWGPGVAEWTVAAHMPETGMRGAPDPSASPTPCLSTPLGFPMPPGLSTPSDRGSVGVATARQGFPAPPIPAYSGEGQSFVGYTAGARSGQAAKAATANAAFGDTAPPWARFWARSLDVVISSLLVGMIIAIIAPSLFLPGSPIGNGFGNIIFGLLLFPLALVMDAVIYTLFGNTLGKRIAGVKVLACDGNKLTFSAYLRRNFYLYVQGYACGTPIVYFGTFIYSWRKASRGELLGWEVATDSACYSVGDTALRSFATAGILIAVAVVSISAA